MSINTFKEELNIKCFLRGNYIIIDTARGSGSGKDFYELTENQLNK